MKFLARVLLFAPLIELMIALPFSPLPLQAQSGGTLPPKAGLIKNLRFEHLTPEEGLPSLVARSIVQDQQGFMWFSTSNGLCRYDGYTFKAFHNNPLDPRSISSEGFGTLYVDLQGVLWMGTLSSGLNAFDRATEQFTRHLHSPDDPYSISHSRVNSIFEDKSGRLWIGTEGGLNRFDRANGRFFRYLHDPGNPRSLSSNRVKPIVEDVSGQLWIGTLGNGLNKLDPASGQFTRYLHDPKNPNSLVHDNIEAIAIDATGGLWLGTISGLDYFDPATRKFTHYRHNSADPQGLSNDNIVALYCDDDGFLWVSTSGGGLNIFNPQTKAFTHVPFEPNAPYGFRTAWPSTIYADRTGALWISTLSDGVYRLDRTATKFESYQNDPNDPGSLSLGSVWSILRDRAGSLWVASLGGGLNMLDSVTGKFQHYRHNPKNRNSLSDDQVYALTEDAAGNLWIGTQKGLNRLNRENGTFKRYIHDSTNPASLNENWVSGLYTDRKGRVWIGTVGKGLDLYDPRIDGFRHYQPDPANIHSISDTTVVTFAEDRSGLLWIGTVSGGLNKLNPETGIFTRYMHDPKNVNSLISNDVAHIYMDPAGILWLATSGGLDKFDPRTETFTHYAEKDGLAGKSLASVIGDSQGKLWVGTMGDGLARFDPDSNTFRNYDRSDGLQSNDFNPRAVCRDSDGKLYFGGVLGVNTFYPNQLRDNAYAPPVVLTDFLIFNRSVQIGEADSQLQRVINETDEITLSHQQSVFSFDFAALNYRAPKKNQYAYRLDGFDSDWNYVDSARRFATYTNLEPGFYTFQVKAANNDGIWNEAGRSIKITITPPWWRTWWFYSLLTAFMLGTGLFIYRSKSNQIKRLQEAALALQKSERNYREVFNATSDALIIQDETGRILDVNDRMCAMFGCNRETALRLSIGALSLNIPPYSQLDAEERVRQAMKIGLQVFEWRSKRCNGELFWSEVALRASEIVGERLAIASIRDITERKRLEEQLIQAQKMESIGRLAGGVAHDFNNILTAISGNAELALMEEDLNPEVAACLKVVEKEAANAAELTKQLLAFSRKQIIEQKLIDLSALIADMEKMLSRLIGEDINLQTFTWPETHLVKVDPGQVHQIIMNLAVNARDAMPNGGSLSIEISPAIIDEAYCQLHGYALPGEYVLLSVCDTGSGMTEEVKKHLFEPFFTTKSPGKGTGLGLATVYGAVKQNNGTIEVHSEPGKGTCFKIYFPKASGDKETLSPVSDEMPPIGGTETILVVEDAASVLNYSRQMLQSLGYRILTASSGEEALRIAQAHSGEIQLLMTDVILPGINGRQLADKLTEQDPGIKVLYCSGYTENAIVHHGVLDPKLHFIGKPFSIPALSRKIRSILDVSRVGPQ